MTMSVVNRCASASEGGRNTFEEEAMTLLPGENGELAELASMGFARLSVAAKDKLWAFLRKYHLCAPELKFVMAQGTALSDFTVALEDLAVAIKSRSSDNDSRGAALYLLADGYYSAAEFVATLSSLGLNVDEYANLMFPGMTSDRMAVLKRWEACSAASLKAQAARYANELAAVYRNVTLFAPSMTGYGTISYRAAGSAGKRARSILTSMKNASVGMSFSKFSICDLSGSTVTSTDYRGRWLVLYIWSPHCGPCKESVSLHRDFIENVKALGYPIQLITLSVNDSDSELQSFMLENAMPFVNCRIGSGSRLLHEWRVGAFPTTILLDGRGVARVKGVVSKELLHFMLRVICER